MSSFFTKLSRVRKNSEEDYLTELFAVVLEEVKTIGEEYIKFLCKKGRIELPTGKENDETNLFQEKYVETQVAVSKGKIDLIIKTNKDIVFICEHKWWGGKLEPDQISKYMSCKDELGFAQAYSVLITPSMEQWDQDPNIKLLWSDIYEFLNSQVNNYSGGEKFILERFVSYLEDTGLAKYNKINPANLFSYFDVINLETSLKDIFYELKSIKWEHECPALNNLDIWNKSNIKPEVKVRWGRVGIDFFDRWKPGLFAGVILDPRDHKLEPDDRRKGPDFVVLLDVDYANKDIYNYVVNSSDYLKLKEKLSNNSGSFTFIPHANLANPWRLAVLKKPLYDILFSKYNYEEQKEAIKNSIIEGINLMFK